MSEPECSQEDLNLEGGEESSKRSRNLTLKRLACKCDVLCEIRSRINGRLVKKYATLEDLLFLTRNIVKTQEEMGQFNDLFKILLGAHEEYNAFFEYKTRVKEYE